MRTPGVPEVSDAPVVPLIDPPVQVTDEVHEPRLPVTVRPFAPVAFRLIPGVVPPTFVMLRNVRPPAPIVVLFTLSAVPVPDVAVLMMLVLFCVALTVPPPVALNVTPLEVVSARPAPKVIVPPVL